MTIQQSVVGSSAVSKYRERTRTATPERCEPRSTRRYEAACETSSSTSKGSATWAEPV